MSLVMGIVVAEPCSYEHRALRILIMTINYDVDKCLILLPDKAVKCVPSRKDCLMSTAPRRLIRSSGDVCRAQNGSGIHSCTLTS